MTFHFIDNPFSETHLVRLKSDNNPDVFRPSAIDEDLSVALKKAKMEELEEVFSREPSMISSAAHSELSIATINAQREAIERISLSAWWAFDRPMKGKLNQYDMEDITGNILPKDGSFSVDIGFVEPACGTGYAAVAILESKLDLPRIVLGGAFDVEAKIAAKKAFLESLQSWLATNWLKNNTPRYMPYWDGRELLRRSCAIRESEVAMDIRDFSFSKFSKYFQDMPMKIIEYDGVFIVGVDAGVPLGGLTYLIAELDKKSNEEVRVFTQHNF